MVIDLSDPLSCEKLRREVFAALIDACSPSSSPHQARLTVARDYDLSYEQIAAIEREGLENEWEPA
jgi:hypothetical protein